MQIFNFLEKKKLQEIKILYFQIVFPFILMILLWVEFDHERFYV